jgi:hypothetical protein
MEDHRGETSLAKGTGWTKFRLPCAQNAFHTRRKTPHELCFWPLRPIPNSRGTFPSGYRSITLLDQQRWAHAAWYAALAQSVTQMRDLPEKCSISCAAVHPTSTESYVPFLSLENFTSHSLLSRRGVGQNSPPKMREILRMTEATYLP